MDCSLSGSSVLGDFPGKNTGVGCHALLLGIFPTQGLNPRLLHCRQILYQLSHQGSPGIHISPLFRFPSHLGHHRATLVAQMVKNPPAMQETQVWSLGQEDPLEKGMATHSSILIWRIPWTEEPGRQQSMGSQSQTWLSTGHWVEFSVLYSRFLLVICFIHTSVYMSIQISKFIPPPPLSTFLHHFKLCICYIILYDFVYMFFSPARLIFLSEETSILIKMHLDTVPHM